MTNIKITAGLFFIFFFVGVAYSAEISTGVKAALIYYRMKGSHESVLKKSPRPSFSGGGYLTISSDDQILAIQPELLLTLTNNKITDKIDNVFNLLIYYLEVPVLFKGSFPLPVSNYFAPFITTGPYMAIKLGDYIGGDNTLNMDFSNLSAGIMMGVGIDLEKTSFEVIYTRGLTKISENIISDSFRLYISRRLGRW